MSEPIISRERIAALAEEAAKQMVRTGLPVPNPYPDGSDSAAIWKTALERYLVLHSAPPSADGIEGGA